MDYRALSKLLLKLASVFIMLYSLGQVGTAIGQATVAFRNEAPWWVLIAGGVLPWLIPFVLGLFLFFLPGTVTNQLLGAQAHAEAANSLRVSRVEEAALIVLSVYVLFKGLGDVAYWVSRVKLYHLFVGENGFPTAPPLSPDDFAQICATVVELLLGVSLFLGARGLVRLRDKLRGRAQDAEAF